MGSRTCSRSESTVVNRIPLLQAHMYLYGIMADLGYLRQPPDFLSIHAVRFQFRRSSLLRLYAYGEASGWSTVQLGRANSPI